MLRPHSLVPFSRRVARLCSYCARRTTTIDINDPSELAMSASRNGAHVGLIAPVERGPSEGARSGRTRPTWVSFPSFYHRASASRKDRLTTPFSSPSLPTSLHEGGLVDPQLRASNEHILIVRVPRARGRPGRPHLPLLANASSSSAPGRAFHWRL